MHRRIVADRCAEAEPALLAWLPLFRAEPAARMNGADVDRPCAEQVLAPLVRDLVYHLLADLAFGLEGVGRRHIGHHILMVQAFLGHLE